MPPPDYVVIPPDTDLRLLLQCPLRARTRDCIRQAFPSEATRSDQPVTVGQLLRIQESGFISLLIDLMCVTEAAFESGFLPSTAPFDSDFSSPAEPSDGVSPLRSDPPDASADAWDPTIHLLKSLLSASSEFRGAQTLTDALNGDIVELAQTLGIADQLNAIPIADLVSGPTLAENTLSALTDLREQMSTAEHLIVDKRLLSEKPLSIATIAQMSKLSGARIRQLQKRIEQNLNCPDGPSATIAIIAILVAQQIGSITTKDGLEEHISAVFAETNASRDAGVGGPADRLGVETAAVLDMAQHMLRKELDYSCSDGICLDKVAITVVQDLQQAAQSIADEIGLVDETELKKHVVCVGWNEHWDALLKRCGLHRLNGQLALRNTAYTRTKAALLMIGHPATKEEIGELSGLATGRVGSILSSLSDVVRADKRRWGLAEWVDDEYEGIPAEIIQRIDEDGGSTRLNRLLDELPRLFKVSENSVRATIASPAFRLEHGWVSIADQPDVHIGKLNDVVHGHDDQNDPYWTFEVDERYLRGYSLRGVPPELAIALGCEFGDRTTVALRAPEQCANISVVWRKTAITGPEIGRISEALTTIGARHGDTACLTIHDGVDVSISRHSHTPDRSLSKRSPNQTSETANSRLGASTTVRKPQAGVQVAKPIRGNLNISDKPNPKREADVAHTSFPNDPIKRA